VPVALVASEILHDDDAVRFQGPEENFLDVDCEALPIDRPIEDPWRLDPVVAQRGQEGRGLPVAVRTLAVSLVPRGA
jgi:hypothetical protein